MLFDGHLELITGRCPSRHIRIDSRRPSLRYHTPLPLPDRRDITHGPNNLKYTPMRLRPIVPAAIENGEQPAAISAMGDGVGRRGFVVGPDEAVALLDGVGDGLVRWRLGVKGPSPG